MKGVVRAAVTQTRNAYKGMPDRVEDLPGLRDCLDEIRTANIEHNVTLIQGAAQQGAQIICLGELSSAPYFALSQDTMWRDLAEDANDGPTVRTMREVAWEQRVVVIAPIYEVDRATGQCFNTAVVIERDGEILGKYRKVHIPHGGNEVESFHERDYYLPSDGSPQPKARGIISKNPFFPVFQTSVGKVAVAICFDRHFAGVTASFANSGAEMIFCPAVSFGLKSRNIWTKEFVVDAARHNIFIAGSNRYGREKPWNVEFYGQSYMVGPNGVLPNISDDARLITCDFDMTTLSGQDPAGWDLEKNKRHEIYEFS
jgi:N-carbamoylputrescine amidase